MPKPQRYILISISGEEMIVPSSTNLNTILKLFEKAIPVRREFNYDECRSYYEIVDRDLQFSAKIINSDQIIATPKPRKTPERRRLNSGQLFLEP